MAKITINDRDLYTDDFNETQQKVMQEINLAGAEMDRMKYVSQVLEARINTLAALILEEEDKKPKDGVEDAEIVPPSDGD